ncbi:hypothetical protein DLJ59_05060 [Micromonospora inaquosa]|uniref:Uncharacterized protein n=1 Tax=Micromonospora inaquosa TaxID=2203716 RepID=A0A3N9X039_9ACTN|nr:hypothetical protein DLJ59_05060 [Micromonospora inaquosa]
MAVTASYRDICRQFWPENSHERLNKEIRRRVDGVGTFEQQSVIRLFDAIPASGPKASSPWAVTLAKVPMINFSARAHATNRTDASVAGHIKLGPPGRLFHQCGRDRTAPLGSRCDVDSSGEKSRWLMSEVQ